MKRNKSILTILIALFVGNMYAQNGEKKPMNIIVIMDDQHRYDLAGFMGHPVVKTPHLDKLPGLPAIS